MQIVLTLIIQGICAVEYLIGHFSFYEFITSFTLLCILVQLEKKK